MKTIKWCGSTECDFCKEEKQPAAIKGNLYDAATVFGCWATMCDKHYKENKRYDNLGIGKGQRYKEQDDGSFVQVEGGSTK